jgi:hypothetical protein
MLMLCSSDLCFFANPDSSKVVAFCCLSYKGRCYINLLPEIKNGTFDMQLVSGTSSLPLTRRFIKMLHQRNLVKHTNKIVLHGSLDLLELVLDLWLSLKIGIVVGQTMNC